MPFLRFSFSCSTSRLTASTATPSASRGELSGNRSSIEGYGWGGRGGRGPGLTVLGDDFESAGAVPLFLGLAFDPEAADVCLAMAWGLDEDELGCRGGFVYTNEAFCLCI
jgi:hypothetical protein